MTTAQITLDHIRATLDGYKLPSSLVLIKDTRDIMAKILDILAEHPDPDPDPFAAICAIIDQEQAYDDDSDPDDIELESYRAIRDIVLGTYQPAPEPLGDTLPPGPIICPNCGECDSWREWAYVAVSQPVRLQDELTGRYAWEMSNTPIWGEQKHDYWECGHCDGPATPEIAAALTIRANA